MSAQTDRSHEWLSGEADGSSPISNTPATGAVDTIVKMATDGALRDIHSRIFQNGIDRRTGEMQSDHIDFELCGPLPLVWRRRYKSSNRERRGELGHGWSHPLQQFITADNGQLLHQDTDGTVVSYPRPAIGQRMYCANQCILSRYGDYLTLQRDGIVHGFEPDPWHPMRWRLVQLLTTNLTHHWQVHYDDKDGGLLTGATGSWGAQVRFVGGRRGWLKVTGRAQAGWPERTLAHYHLDRHGDLIAVRDGYGRLSQYRYSNHLCRLHRTTDGSLRRFDWDTSEEEPRCTRAFDLNFSWDSKSRTSQAMNDRGQIDSLVFDRDGRLVLHRHCDGDIEHWQYDDLGRLRAHSGPHGARRYDFDEQNRLVRFNDTADQTMSLHYQKDRPRPNAIVDADGQRTTFHFRFDGRPTSVYHADGREEHWTYRHDRLIRYRDRHSLLHHYTWDEELGVLARYECIALTDAMQPIHALNGQVAMRAEVSFEFDEQGWMHSRVVQNNQHHSLIHDEMGHLRQVKDDADRTWTFDYDGNGRLAIQTHPNGRTTHFRYDRDARPTALILPGGDEVRCAKESRPVSHYNDQLSRFIDVILERQAPTRSGLESRAIPSVQEHLLDHLIGPDSLVGLRTSNPPARYGTPMTES